MSATLAPSRTAPPGPRQHWFSGNLPEFRRDRLGFLTACAREYGDVVALRFGPKRIMVVNHPDLVEEVLVTHNRHYIKHFALRMAKPTLGNGLLTSEGEFWLRQRKLAQPAFHRERIAGYAATMVEFTERMLQTWADGQHRDSQDDMMRLTQEIVVKCLFSADVSGRSGEISGLMEESMRCFTARVNKLFKAPMFVPTPLNLRSQRVARRLNELVFAIIAERRQSGADHGDLLSMLLHARDEDDGGRMTDRQLRDEVMTLFMAGHETTANTLAWAFYLLAQHPEAESRLFVELDEVLAGRAPTLADLPRLKYTDMVVTETLRVLPTVWLLGREAVTPTEVGSYPVPIGMTVYMSQWVLHRDPRFFDDPEAFRPERWADGLMKRLPRYAYFPFGGGPRICIGNTFAQMEAVLLLATIARCYRLRLAPGAVVTPLPTMTLRPDRGVRVILERRSSPHREGT